MKWLKILAVSILINGCSILKIEDKKMAVHVPDTNTFSLQDVVAAVEDHAGNIADDLDTCFVYADRDYFDVRYDDDSYAPPQSMKRFRNYGPFEEDPNYPIFVPTGFSPNGDGVHDYFEVQNLQYYPVHNMRIVDRYNNLLYERTNDYHLNPWDGRDPNGQLVASGNYTWTLEISGKPYDGGTVMVAY